MSTIIPLSEDKIIHVIERDETNTPEPNLKVVEENKRFCPHQHLNIFIHHRHICCIDCGAHLDAFEALVSFSNKENRFISEFKWLQYEIKQKQQEKENLLREITNLKVQKRKLA